MRQLLDDYLDENLTSDQRADLERRLAAEPALARLLAAMKQERALRAAAYASFQPSVDETRNLANRILNDIAGHHPAGYVGSHKPSWLKRTLGVAAALAILAGTFAIGRITAPT